MNKLQLLCALSVLISASAIASEDCDDLKNKLEHVGMANGGIGTALALLSKLGQNCPEQTANELNYFVADSVAKEANNLVNHGQLVQAESLLAKAPVVSWTVASVRGDIAGERKQWNEAAQQFRQAYVLLVEQGKVRPLPNQAGLEAQLQQTATEANLINGKMEESTMRGSSETDPIFGSRGIGVKPVALPVHFATGKAELDADGTKSAEQLAVFLAGQQKIKEIVLAGFSDPRGNAAKNVRLSKQRAEVVAAFLKNKGIEAAIQTIGKGEQPPPRSQFKKLTRDEEYQLWRRVELQVSR